MATATNITAIPSNVQEKYSKEMEALKKEARSVLMAAASTKLMILIDKFERLGLAYHFDTEIENKLKQVYDSIEDEQDYDLFATALQFRLLRQHQYHVSCNVFNKFVGEDSKWKESLSSDVEGLLSLYEAAHVRIRNENILDDAVAFTVHHLTRMLTNLESPIKEKVEQALKRAIHRGLPLLNVRFYISVYGRDASTEEFLVKLAKLNFNFLQNIYRKELAELTRAYNKEQKWIMERQMPPFEEYMTNSVFTSCIYVMFMAFVPGMKSVTEEVVQWLLSEPKIVISTAKMGRTLDDLGSHERENKEGKLPTVVDCYMNDKGVSKQEALSEFVELVEDGWKDITEEWVKAGERSAPNELIQQLLNYGGAAEMTYNNREDGYTDPEKYLGPLIAALYVDPLLI
ncbi:hypothetical protein C2S52_012419 [Perilla frutescens var. hirtella]|nr:hypothetical protein C2S52_012419 [Perilla frutescens var. hirtella]